MLFMITSRTRQDLTPAEYTRLSEIARDFYRNIPPGVQLLHDWAACDGSCTFAVIEADDAELVSSIQAPFAAYVHMELTQITPVSGWKAQ
jgi:hypothetical protein